MQATPCWCKCGHRDNSAGFHFTDLSRDDLSICLCKWSAIPEDCSVLTDVRVVSSTPYLDPICSSHWHHESTSSACTCTHILRCNWRLPFRRVACQLFVASLFTLHCNLPDKQLVACSFALHCNLPDNFLYTGQMAEGLNGLHYLPPHNPILSAQLLQNIATHRPTAQFLQHSYSHA
jgi:hypothetical protein